MNGNDKISLLLHLPAMQAVMKQAMLPPIMAVRPSLARSDLLDGARAPIPPIWTPMEPKLENPHRAYVAITSERS